ncbi:MAG TPA: hypothetical protein VF192_01315 [Longimicrobiales bacterium]
MAGYGNWGKHIELFSLWESANEDPAAMLALVENDMELLEGTGAIEGRADFPIFLQTVIRHRMRERFRAVAAQWQQYVGMETAQDFREHTVSQLNGIRGIRGINEDGEYPRLRTSEEEGPSFAVGKHGGTYAVTMELVINDETDKILNRTPRELGRSMAEYQAQVITAFIESNPTYGPDGQPFFGVAHDNEVTGAAAEPNETNLLAALDKMELRRDPDGIPFTVRPRRIIVRTPSQKATFDRIIRSQLTGVSDGPVTNASLGFGQFFTGQYNPAFNVLPPDAVVNDVWLNDPNDWYVLGDAEDRAPFVYATLRNRREPFIGIKDQGVRDAMGAGSDPYSWWFDTIDYKVRHFFGVAPGEPLAAMRMRP